MLNRALGAIHDRLLLMLNRGTLERVDDSDDLQQAQVSIYTDDVVDGCERVGQYGLTSNPPAGAACVVGLIGGHRSHPVLLGVDDRSRPHPLDVGDSCVYNQGGVMIWLNGTQVKILGASSVVLDAPLVHITGNLQVDGTINGHLP